LLQAQRNRYMETTLQTASPSQLLIMLYDGAIRFCKAGIEAIKEKKFEDANRQMLKVQDILSEFIITLDRNVAMSDDLDRLYEYMKYRLREANAQKATEPAEEVLQYLLELKEVWIQAVKLGNQSSSKVTNG
jgi:flagellar protein FliS